MNEHVHPQIKAILDAFQPLTDCISMTEARTGKTHALKGETPLQHAKRIAAALHPCPAPKQIERLAANIEKADSLPDKMGKAIEAFRTAREKQLIERAIRSGKWQQGLHTSDGRPVSESGVELDHDDHYHDKREKRTEDFDAGQE